MLKRFICFFVAVSFLVTSIISPVHAQVLLDLPVPGQMIGLSQAFAPVSLKGVSIHPQDPLLFDFIVDHGQAGLSAQALTDETTKLVKYFLAGIAVPDKDLWVNLSPKEQSRIMADELSHTDVGRDMLAQDYILKQMTSSLMYPENDLGKQFWAEVYKRTYEKFGNIELPVDTFNKVWITPSGATVYQKGNDAFVADSHLKVMLESDYMAIAASEATPAQELAKDVVREIILPVLEKEVNSGRNFAALRQLFHSLILAGWYKKALKESLLNQVYANTNKVEGIDIAEKDIRERVYARYLEAYQRGVYNYVKEEFDQNTRQLTPRKYFSGGIVPGDVTIINNAMKVDEPKGDLEKISYRVKTLENAQMTEVRVVLAKKHMDFIDNQIDKYIHPTYKNYGDPIVFWLHNDNDKEMRIARRGDLESLVGQYQEASAQVLAALISPEENVVQTRFLEAKQDKRDIFQQVLQDVVDGNLSIDLKVVQEAGRSSEDLKDDAQAFEKIEVKLSVQRAAFIKEQIEEYGNPTYKNHKEPMHFRVRDDEALYFIVNRHTDLEKMVHDNVLAASGILATLISTTENIVQRRFLGAVGQEQRRPDDVFQNLLQDVIDGGLSIDVTVDRAAKDMIVENALVHGGIDLGNGEYLKVIAVDAVGMPSFDPAQLMQLQKDLRGVIPVPVGVPQPVNFNKLLGL